VRLIGLGASQLVDDAVQVGLFEDRELSSEELLHSIDRLRGKYGRRALETGLTFFEPDTGSREREP
jgi:hypothetical protein